MSQKNPLLIELPYLPPLSWFALAEQYDKICLDAHEHYVKGSYRNRCHIAGPNGIQRLSIPLKKGKHQQSAMHEVRIDYSQNWQKDHWQSLCSAYRRSVYFEYFEDIFYPFYHSRTDKLLDLNYALLRLIFKIMKTEKDMVFTERYIEKGDAAYDDYRTMISPKKEMNLPVELPVYTQVFSDRFTFFKDMSIVDFIFNTGNK